MDVISRTGWFSRPSARDWVAPAASSGAREFHRGLPGYAPTPLVSAPGLAAELGVGAVLVKDESARLGLPAFKILGASWAIARVVAEYVGVPANLVSLRRGAVGSGLRLVTATDGNHGRAVARMAGVLGLAATVFVPTTMSPAAAEAIAGEGAEVIRTEGGYDETVSLAAAFASGRPDRELVQDTAWPGYEQVPAWIVEGYETMLEEIDEQLGGAPDLVAVPAGVGSLAQAVVTHYRQRRTGTAGSATLLVEPDTAACVLASLAAGAATSVETQATVMAGLNCGTVSAAAWPVLQAGCDAAISVTDREALIAVHDLVEHGISAGPSGAASLAGVRAALAVPERREALGLSRASTVVILSTEGSSR